jgi:hypothetical protein
MGLVSLASSQSQYFSVIVFFFFSPYTPKYTGLVGKETRSLEIEENLEAIYSDSTNLCCLFTFFRLFILFNLPRGKISVNQLKRQYIIVAQKHLCSRGNQ